MSLESVFRERPVPLSIQDIASQPLPARAFAGASLSIRLREETRAVHTRLELALPLLDGALTLAEYRAIVEGFYGFYAPIERALSHLNDASALCLRPKLPSLRADLRSLGSSDADVDALPRCGRIPKIMNAADALGCLYVIEGATLGGQIILRSLAARFSIGAKNGAAFFAGYGEQTGPMWRAFVEELDASPYRHAETIVAAMDTFEMLEAWLRERGALWS